MRVANPIRTIAAVCFACAFMVGMRAQTAAAAAKPGGPAQSASPQKPVPDKPGPDKTGPDKPVGDKARTGEPDKTGTRATAPQETSQERLVADTARLFQLAQDLKVEVDKSTKDTMSVTVVKKAAEVEQLAHDLKERMKAEAQKPK